MLSKPHPWCFFFFSPSRSLKCIPCHLLGDWYNHRWVLIPLSLKQIEWLSIHLLHRSQSKTDPDIQPFGEKSRLIKSSSESKWLDFSWRGQQVWREDSSSTLLNVRCHFKLTTEHWSYTPRKQHHSPVLWPWRLFVQPKHCLLWSFPEPFSGEAQVKMTTKLINYLI